MVDAMTSAPADGRYADATVGTQPIQFSLATPLTGRPRVTERHADGVTAIYVVDPAELVLIGHFPGFPIFPGVCLIECAHQAALLALSGNVTLAAVERARFFAPVFPGDEITARVAVAGHTCRAELSVRRGADGHGEDAALIRLRYREGEHR